MPALLERLRHLPNDSIVYHTAITQDTAGSHFIGRDAINSTSCQRNQTHRSTSLMTWIIGKGTVGGYLISWAADGQVAAAMALRVLNGEKPQNIPIVRNNNVYMFDWRAMRRWGLSEGNLPAGQHILFRELSVWERTKWYWISALFIIPQPLRSYNLSTIRPENN